MIRFFFLKKLIFTWAINIISVEIYSILEKWVFLNKVYIEWNDFPPSSKTEIN